MVTFVLLSLVLIDLTLMGLKMFGIFPNGGCDLCQKGHDHEIADAATHTHTTCGDDAGKFNYGLMQSPSELKHPENSDACFALEVQSNIMTIIYLVELTLKMGCVPSHC